MKILNLGCGRNGHNVELLGTEEKAEIITLDQDSRLAPDLVCKLGKDRIQLADDAIDLALAIHVLEHIGRQGETEEWFFFFEELYRVLKPGGKFQFESPLYSSVWAWSDPEHKRALAPQSFIFFEQDAYRRQKDCISPFRINCDFKPLAFEGLRHPDPALAANEPFSSFRGVLVANKPLKPWWEDQPGIA